VTPLTTSFSVPVIPIAQPRQKHRIINTKDGKSFVHNYTAAKHKVNDFKATVRMAHGAPKIIDGPVRLKVVFVLPRPKNKCWKKKPTPAYYHTSKPDLDNLLKSVKDALSGVAYRDDAQICELEATKVVAAGDEQPRVDVTIEEIEELDKKILFQ
jgi:Holliday junction resolvase RusA-like endonuclease